MNLTYISLRQRTGKKYFTYIEQLPDDLDLDKICRFLKKI